MLLFIFCPKQVMGQKCILGHQQSFCIWRPVHNYKQNEAQHFQDAKVILKLFVKGNAHTDTRKVKMSIFVLQCHCFKWNYTPQIGV